MQNIPNISQTTSDILQSLPYLKSEWIIVIGFLLVIVTDLFFKNSKNIVAGLAALTLIISGVILLNELYAFESSQLLFNGMFVFSKSALQFKILVVAASLFSLLFFYQDDRLKNHPKGINDFIAIFLAGTLGMFLLISSANLLMLYLSVEMISLVSYLMVAYNAYQKKEAEASMKYVLFGTVSSAIMLYGISLIYGFTGTINLYNEVMLEGLRQTTNIPAYLAVIMVLAGISFKLSAVPFHFWTPDAYEAAPTSVVSFLATAPKIAVFGFLYYLIPSFQNGDVFNQFILAVAATSMILGNVIAVFQNDAKRMMAYSAIGHTGFILMLFVLPQAIILKSLLCYLAIYSIANIGTFMSLASIENSYGFTKISELKGLGKNMPAVAVGLVLLLVSLIGLPPTAGFIAKFLVFSSLLSVGLSQPYILVLLIVAAITTVVSLFYYLKIPLNLFLKKSDLNIQIVYARKTLRVYIIFLALLTLLLGLFPSILNYFTL